MIYQILIGAICIIGYLLPIFFSVSYILKLFKEKTIKYFLVASCNYLPFLSSYLYLLTQTSNASFGIWFTPLYLLQYFYWILAITIFQKYFFTAVLFSTINGILLFLLPILLRKTYTGGGFISFGWDWAIALPITLIFIINHFVSFGYISDKIRKAKKSGVLIV